ncbi:MAG: DUF883 family protein [Limisphaerales bacterium]
MESHVNTRYIDAMNETEATNQVRDWQRRAAEKARDMGQLTDQYVRENAWTTLAVVAVVGCFIGFLLANRND